MQRSSFGCLVRSELRKLLFQRSNWALPVVAVGLGIAAATAAADAAPTLPPAQIALDSYRTFAAVAIGATVLMLAARLVAAEYEHGTARVVLARGVGRLRLLVAQLMAVAAVASPLLLIDAAAGAVFLWLRLGGQLASVRASEIEVAAIAVLLSTAVCLVLGVAAGAIGRSLTFALALAAGFFPADNILGFVLPLLQNATQEQVWADATGYLLGPTLNHLPALWMNRTAAELVAPEVPGGPSHALLVVAGYVLALGASAALLTWRRDVLA